MPNFPLDPMIFLHLLTHSESLTVTQNIAPAPQSALPENRETDPQAGSNRGSLSIEYLWSLDSPLMNESVSSHVISLGGGGSGAIRHVHTTQVTPLGHQAPRDVWSEDT